MRMSRFGLAAVLLLLGGAAGAQEKPVVGVIPRAARPVQLDGKLDEWGEAFVTPVHVGHPDFPNRGAQFYYLWDEENLYIGLLALDQKPAHVGPDKALYDGDAVEFYLDTRRGDQLGSAFGPGTLHMFWTPLTGTEFKPRLAVRPLPAFKGFTLQGAAVAAERTAWGWTAEFRLPWKNFPDFRPRAGDVIGIDCELCSGDGGRRVDRTFVYSSPASVGSPASFGRVRLVNAVGPDDLAACARAVLPVAVTRSANYGWVYATAGLSPTVERLWGTVTGTIRGPDGKAGPATGGARLAVGGLAVWIGTWEVIDPAPGAYTVAVVARDKAGRVLARREVPLVFRGAAGGK